MTNIRQVASVSETDLLTGEYGELLARYQPILSFDERELFFPISIEDFVDASQLYVDDSLILEHPTVSDLDHRWGANANLRFVTAEERRGVFPDDVRRTARRILSSRLGLVGLAGRIIDALFLILVVLRATTAKATATAADVKVRQTGMQRRKVCYGRAVHCGEWLVLHYAYLYAMNDWRTGYRGMNDHEGDWEQAWVYCDPADGKPQWVAASNHEAQGANCRRHWNDPELIRDGDRPVLFAAGGSHALYFQPGDYVARFDLPGLRWFGWFQRFGRRLIGTHKHENSVGGPAVGIPFVDNATGDGLYMDSAELREMAGENWCELYRGLWGVDTGDPLQAERGPGGPKFDRRGQIRWSWADPLGHAGLHGTPPPSALRARINLEKITRSLYELDEQIRFRGRLLPLIHQSNRTSISKIESERLSELLRQKCELEELKRRVEADEEIPVDIRAHLDSPVQALSETDSSSVFVAAWALLSIPIILGSIGVALLVENMPVLRSTVAVFCFVILIEQILRGRIGVAIRMTIWMMLFFAGAFALVTTYFWITNLVLGFGLIAAAVLLFGVNAGEAWRTMRTRRKRKKAAHRAGRIG